MKSCFLICSLILSVISFSQTPACDYTLQSGSCALQSPKAEEAVELMEVKIKNNYLVQFIKVDKKIISKLLLKMI